MTLASSSITLANVNDGAPGKTGATGNGIRSVTVSYGVSASASTQPTSWGNTIPTVSAEQYLWTRTITDYTDDAVADTVTYTYALQGKTGKTGASAKDFTLYQSATYFEVSPRGMTHKMQVISITCVPLNLTSPTITWSVSSAVPTQAISSDKTVLSLTVQSGVALSDMTVACAVSGIGTKTIKILATPVGEDGPIYLGTDWSIDSVDTTTDGDPLRYGDYFLSTADDGTSASGVYVYDGEKWVEADALGDSKAIATACSGVLPTVLNQGMNVAKRAGALYAYIGTLASTNAVIDNLFAYEITMLQRTDSEGNVISTGSIQSGNYDHSSQTGWKIDFDGSAEFGNVVLKDAQINGGQISISNSDGVVFATNTAGGSETAISAVGVMDMWLVSDMTGNLTANAETALSCSWGAQTGDAYYLNTTDTAYKMTKSQKASEALTLNSSSGSYLYRYAVPESKSGDTISLSFTCSEDCYLTLRDKNGSTSGTPTYTIASGGASGLDVIGALGFGSLIELRNAGWREFVLTSRTGKAITVSAFTHGYTEVLASYTCPAQSLVLLKSQAAIATLGLASYVDKANAMVLGTASSDDVVEYTSIKSFLSLLADHTGNFTCYQSATNTYTDGTPRSIGGASDKMLSVSITSTSITITHHAGTLTLKTGGDPIKGTPNLQFTPQASKPGATVQNLNPSFSSSKIGTTGNPFSDAYITTMHTSFAFVGMVAYFYRLTAPDGWVVCDGASGIYKGTPLYTLLKSLGTSYYATSWSAGKALVYDSTNDCFLLDLVGNKIGKSSDNQKMGMFLRAVMGATSKLGTVQQDEIRSLTGSAALMIHSSQSYSGAITTEHTGNSDGNSGSTRGTRGILHFNANKGDTNGMAGHAQGDDIHPANVQLLPCIYTGAIA